MSEWPTIWPEPAFVKRTDVQREFGRWTWSQRLSTTFLGRGRAPRA